MTDQTNGDLPETPTAPAAPGSYGAYPSSGPTPLPPASTTKATVALVLAIVPILFTWIAAVVLAIQVLSDSRDGRNHGKGRAIAALVICALWLAATAVIIIVALTGRADRDSTGKVTGDGSVDVTKIQVGDCLKDNVAGEESAAVNVVPCSKTHLYEAYANFTLPDGDYPGDDEVVAAAEQGCVDRFESYIGIGYDDSEIDVTYLHPLDDSWKIDRGVTCLATEGGSTGSLKGAKR